MLGEGIVARVVGRHSHNGSSTVAGKHIFSNPDGDLLIGKRIDSVTSREHTSHLVVHLTIALCTLLHIVEILVYLGFLLRRREFCHEVALRSQHHKGDTKHRIGTSGENREMLAGISDIELYFRSFASANPVALGLFQRVSPIDLLETIEQTLGISADTQTPLAHLLLHHRIASTNADSIYDFIVCQYSSQLRTPVHHRICQIGYTIVHQHLLLLLLREACPVGSREVKFLRSKGIAVFSTHQFEVLDQLDCRLSLMRCCAEITLEHALEGPLSPLIIDRIASADFSVPIE